MALYASPSNPEAEGPMREIAEQFAELRALETPLAMPTPISSVSSDGHSEHRHRRSERRSDRRLDRRSSGESLATPPTRPAAMGLGLFRSRTASRQSSRSNGSSRDGAAVQWILFLTTSCFEGEQGERLASEVHAALRVPEAVQPVLLWSPEQCQFHDIIDATPRSLVIAGFYAPLAIEWRHGMLRAVSVRLVAKALGARLGGGTWPGCSGAMAGLSSCVAATCAGATARLFGGSRTADEGHLVDAHSQDLTELEMNASGAAASGA